MRFGAIDQAKSAFGGLGHGICADGPHCSTDFAKFFAAPAGIRAAATVICANHRKKLIRTFLYVP